MGNGCGSGGRWSRKGSPRDLSRNSSRRRVGLGTVPAIVALLFAAFGWWGASQRVGSQNVLPQASASPIPGFLQSASFSPSSFLRSSRSSPRSNPESSNFRAKTAAQGILGRLPLMFEPNQGQADAGVKFMARGAGYGLFLDASGAALALQTAPAKAGRVPEQLVRMRLAGADPGAEMRGTELLPGKSNYFTGNDRRKWHTEIPQYAGVRYRKVYPGIDLVFYGSQGHLEYDFHVAPGADPSRAELQFSGASKLEVNGRDLIVVGADGNRAVMRMRAPVVYQQDGDRRTPVDGNFVLRAENRVRFAIGKYDHGKELIIDPALEFSSYFGMVNSGSSPAVAVNNDGTIYLSGSTTSDTGFPTTTTPTTLGTAHVFVARINPSSPPSLIYLTFLGGNGTDTSVGLGVDLAGNTYVAGNTTSSSTSFPTTSLAYQTSPMAKGPQCTGITCTSLFVSAIASTGSTLNYSSYVSGNGNDVASGMTIDTSQDVYVTGTTTSNDVPSGTVAFPATLVPVPLQTSPFASTQFFVTKVNTRIPGIGSIAYSTYFGGSLPSSPIAAGGGVAVDTTGNIYFSGTTNFFNSGSGIYGSSGSGDFPILNAYQACLDTIPPAVLPPPVVNTCVAPTAPYPTDGFLAKINPTGQSTSQLLFSSYLGGTATDTSTAITVDSGAANVYITGSTNSNDFLLPTGTQAFQSCLNDPGVVEVSTSTCPTGVSTTNTDAYVARFAIPAASTTGVPNFLSLTYFSYLGGGENESGNSIAVDTASDALVTGYTTSTNFPATTGAIQTVLNGAQNAFFAHINTSTTAQITAGNYATYFGGNGTDNGTSIAVDTYLNTYFAGTTTSTNLQVADSLQGTFNAPGPDAFVVKLGSQSDLCITCVLPFVSPSGNVAAGNQVTVTYNLANLGPDVATGISVLAEVPTGVAFDSGGVSGAAGTCSAPSGTNLTCQIPTLQAGSSVTLTFVVTPAVPGTFEVTAIVSDPTNTNTNNTTTASFTSTGYTVNVTPSSQTVAAGNLAQYNVVVSPTQGVFGANVSLTCSGQVPTGASCNFSTSTINLSNGTGSASTILNLTTTAQPVNSASAGWHRPLYALWLAVPGMAFLGVGAGRRRRRNWLLGLIALMAFFTMSLLQPACSSPKTQPTVSGTPSGTYPLTVTATSGSFTKTAPFVLTVIP
jgi:Domain of unknown function DUF11/Beta-propeller repeat